MKRSDTLLLFRPREAAHVLAISIATLYRLIRRGHIRAIKVGACTRIPADELQRFVQDRVEGEHEPDAGDTDEERRIRP